MTIALTGNIHRPDTGTALGQILSFLHERGVGFVVDETVAPLLHPERIPFSPIPFFAIADCIQRADVLIALGGDGTILYAAHAVGTREIPVLGVNLGKLGFLAEVSPDEMDTVLGQLLAGELTVERRLLLEAEVSGSAKHRMVAVNDIVVGKSHHLRLINAETFIDGDFAVTYRADGLIVSTPTGSTAYALSNGGPIVVPTSRVIGLTPIAPHTLSGRPLIVPDTSEIRVDVRESIDQILVTADGQREVLVRPPVSVVVRKGPSSLHLLRRPERSTFDVLRAKLHWGFDPRGAG